MSRGSSRLSVKLRRAPTKYRPLARLASGGMAEVWRAEAIFEDGRTHPVAIKRVLPELAQQSLWQSMFEDEARLGMQLRHPNIVRVYDARHIGDSYIMVMELVDGSSLRELQTGAHERRASMPVPAALHIIRELARGLDYTHTAQDELGQHLGVVHRDVSPHNVLLGRDGSVKLTDFGLADAKLHRTVRSEELVGGKLGYLSPEVVAQQPGDHRVDLFGAGIILWEMLAGRPLFQGRDDAETVRNVAACRVPSLPEINRNVPAEVDSLAARLLCRDPEGRPPSARLVREELDDLLARIDPQVGSKDVALLVGLSRAGTRPRTVPPPPGPMDELMHELRQFADESQGAEYDLGAEPLDPDDFRVVGRRPPRRR